MELPVDPRIRKALSLAMRRLVSSSRLSSEIAKYLNDREYSEPEIEEVLSFLTRHKLLDDEKTIQSLVEQRSGTRSAGKGKIRADLQRRGAPDDAIERILQSRSDEDELEASLSALRKRRWPPNSRFRAARFLISRGHDEDIVKSALERFFGPDELSAE